MAQIEPMDVDDIVCEFDDKENSLQNSNVLPRTPCTEKGYEELDVSELNMKLHYSITPASTPMSLSYTNKESKLFNQDDSMNMLNDSSNLSQSLNSTLIKCETKPLKLPLQAIPNDFLESNLASSMRRSLDPGHGNCTITVDELDNIDGNLLPSTSSSSVQTPEATTPTKDIPKDGGSPILRGLKSVLNLFRTSQGPALEETPNKNKTVEPLATDTILASTPLTNKNNTSRRNSPLKESLVFSDDLEKELQWKDDSTIIFKHEKIPIHKLFYNEAVEQKIPKKFQENLDSTVEKMDISYNESMAVDKTMTEIITNTPGIGINCAESDSEFVDCETYTNNVNQTGSELKQKVVTHKEASESQIKIEPNKEFQLNNEYELSAVVPAIESISDTFEYNAHALNKEYNDNETKNEKDKLIENEQNPVLQEYNDNETNNEEVKLMDNEQNPVLQEYNDNETNNEEDKLMENVQNPVLQGVKSMLGTIMQTNNSLNDDIIKEQNKNEEFKSNNKSELSPIVQDKSISGTIEHPVNYINKENNGDQTKDGEFKSTIESIFGPVENPPSSINKENNKNHSEDGEFRSKIENTLNPILEDVKSMSGNIEKANPITREINENQTSNYQSNIENIVNPFVQETVLELDIIEKTSVNNELKTEIFDVKTYNTDDDLISNNLSVSSNIDFQRSGINNQLFNTGIKTDTTMHNYSKDFNLTVHSSTNMEPSIENFNTSHISENTNTEINEVLTNNEKSTDISVCGDGLKKMETEPKTSLQLDVTSTLQLIKNVDQIGLQIDSNLAPISNIIEEEETCINNLNATIPLLKKSGEEGEKVNLTFDMDNMDTTIDTETINHSNGLVDLQNCNISTYLANIESMETTDNKVHNFINTEQVIDNNLEQSSNKLSDLKIENNVECTAIVNNVSIQFNSINNDLLNNEANISLTNNFEGNTSVDFENKAKSEESLSNVSNTDIPSEIPLPVDEDIGQDSLTEPFIITKEAVKSGSKAITESSQNIDTSTTTYPLQESSVFIDTPFNKIPETPDNDINCHVNESEISIDQTEKQYNIEENDVKNLSVSDNSIVNRTFTQIQQAPQTVETNKTLDPQNVSELCNDQLENNPNLTEKAKKYLSLTDNSIEISPQVKSESFNNNLNFFDEASVDKTQNIMQLTKNSSLETLHQLNVNLEDEQSLVSTAKNITIDEEHTLRENNSPYPPVDFKTTYNNCDLNKDQYESTESGKMEREGLISPPISPKLSPKGYNINFDDIDDPFATKSNIRLSPPLGYSPVNTDTSHNQEKADLNRQEIHYRRKSQPVKKIRNISKKPFNNSFDSALSKNKNETPAIMDNEAKSNIKAKDVLTDDKSFIPIKGIDDLNLETPNPVVNIIPLEFEICNKSSQNSQKEVIQESIQKQSNEESNNDSNFIPENVAIRNVFNLPEIDDINFNPFSSKTKLRQSPPSIFDKNSTVALDDDDNFQVDKDISPNTSNVTLSSKSTDVKDNTVREVNTEDEDTIEGPFFDADVLAEIDKLSDDGLKTGSQYEDFPVQNDDDKNDGELFIDAEAFEFLLNRNTNNVVLDSGKESLFLKFDPLLAKRVSSDGVLTELHEVQRKRSTSKTPLKETIENDREPTTAPRTSIIFTTLTEENQEETNATTSKPMMVVSPAVSSLVSPRKSTPPRINRRSLTFPSPAMVVIDRLLSLSGNNSILEQDVTMTQPSRQYNETDIALAQLRDLLEEKHIEVQNLKCESEELNMRLSSMESQIRNLERERDERVKKINDLNESLALKTKMNITMSGAVEEYEKTIVTLIAKLDEDKKRNAEERARIISERDEQTAHLANMETTFSDLHSKYEKSKHVILNMKANEDILLKSHEKLQNTCEKLHQNYELLKQHASSKLSQVNQELEGINRAHQAEVLRLNAQVKRKDLEIKSLEESLSQKTKANEELTAICDELINNRLN